MVVPVRASSIQLCERLSLAIVVRLKVSALQASREAVYRAKGIGEDVRDDRPKQLITRVGCSVDRFADGRYARGE